MSKTDGQCKIGRVGDRYAIDVDEQILQKRENNGTSLGGLEKYLGGILLRRAMEEAELDFLEGDPERYYRLLVDDKASRLETEQVRRRLEAAGIDVDDVLADVPSYQSIRHHLADCLDKDTSGTKTNEPSPSRIKNNIRALKSRTERVVAGSLATLRDDDRENPDTLDVYVDITVMCECGRSMSAFTLLKDGCNCGL